MMVEVVVIVIGDEAGGRGQVEVMGGSSCSDPG